MFFFKVFAKFIGVLLMIIGAVTLIALIVALFSVGVVDIIHIPGIDFANIVNAGNTPVWLVSLLTLFAVGIPFFFLFYLGLKILINNLKSIGNIAKFTLLGVWLISIIGLTIIGIREASEHAFDQDYVEKTELQIATSDTLNIKMVNDDKFSRNFYRYNNFRLAHDDNGNKMIYSADIDIIVKSTTDSIATIAINRSADGRSYEKALERAKNINYSYDQKSNTLLLDSYFTINPEDKFSDQEIDIILYLPEGSIVNFNKNTKSFLSYRRYDDNIVSSKKAGNLLKILEDDIECLDCPEEENFEVEVNTPGLKINDEGVEIKSDDSSLKIDENGVKAKSEDVKVNINSDGIKIESED